MKKILFTILVFMSFHGFSQTSFKMQVDTALHVYRNNPPGQIIGCADGGIAIGGATYGSSILLKFDSIGNMQWSKIGRNVTDYAEWGIQLLATSDSGFYMKTEDEPDMFGWFGWPVIQKFDKNGNVLHSARTYVNYYPGWLQGNNINIKSVEKYNDNLHGYGRANFYDSDNDVQCCSMGYSFKFDSTLSLSNKFATKYLLYDSLEVPYEVNIISNLDSQFFAFNKYDTSGMQLGVNYFLYDTTEFHFINTWAMCQDKKNIYSLHAVQVGSSVRFGLLKTDLSWNTNYFMVLDSTPLLPSIYYYWRNTVDMNKSDSGNLLISAILYNSNYHQVPLMIEIDTMGTINYAWLGDGTDSLYSDNIIDTTSQSALFLSTIQLSQNKFAFQFEKQYLSAPTCGFIPINLSPYFISITDSSVTDTILPFVPTEPHVYNTFISSQPITVVPSTPICGVLSNVGEIKSDKCSLEAYPNPAGDFINLSLNCEAEMYSSIVIINLLGAEIPVSGFSKNANQIIFDTKGISNGIYSVLSRFNDGTTISRKIIIQH